MSSIGVDIVEDLNLGNNIGAKQEPFTIDANMQRSSSYDNYYKRSKHRKNLHVKSLSPVQRVAFEQKGGDLVATGVIYTDAESGMTRNVTASKEVILSAGSLHSPQLLMLSVRIISMSTILSYILVRVSGRTTHYQDLVSIHILITKMSVKSKITLHRQRMIVDGRM